MSNGLVSTIIPVYNRPEMVKRAVASVLAQTYRPIEIIIVDDGSTDGTPLQLQALQSTYPQIIRVLQQANAGAGPARETGRQEARGEYIQYLDSDDLLLPNKFHDQVAALAAHPDCAIAYGTSIVIDGNGRTLSQQSRRTAETLPHLFPELLNERWWHTHTPLFRRWISDAAGAWPPHRPEDWDLEARMAALMPRLIHCGSTVSVQVDHSEGERVSQGPAETYLRDEAVFLPRLHACALLAGVDPASPQMITFSRWCFLRARQLDAIGESKLASNLLILARLSGTADPGRATIWQSRMYGVIRRLIGSRLSGWLAGQHHPLHPRMTAG